VVDIPNAALIVVLLRELDGSELLEHRCHHGARRKSRLRPLLAC
jgi:hypothetical protein